MDRIDRWYTRISRAYAGTGLKLDSLAPIFESLRD